MTLKQSTFTDIASLGATRGAGDWCLVVRLASDLNFMRKGEASCRLERNGVVLREFDESTIDLSDGLSLRAYRDAFSLALNQPLRLELTNSFRSLDIARTREKWAVADEYMGLGHS